MASHITQIKILGAVELILGLIAFGLQVYVTNKYDDYYESLAPGIWCGMVFVISAKISIYASRHPESPSFKKMWLIVSAVNFISIIFAIVLLALAIKSLQLHNTICRKLQVISAFSNIFGTNSEIAAPLNSSCTVRVGIESGQIACAVGASICAAVLVFKARIQKKTTTLPGA